MRKQHLTMGIAFALVASACTGIGVQTGPTLTSQIADEQALGNLWGERSEESPNGVVVEHDRNGVELADLWVEGGDVQEKTDRRAPRASALVERLTLTESVFGSYPNTSEVLPK